MHKQLSFQCSAVLVLELLIVWTTKHFLAHSLHCNSNWFEQYYSHNRRSNSWNIEHQTTENVAHNHSIAWNKRNNDCRNTIDN